MGPVKFGDIEKTAKDVLDEDHHSSGFQLKNKFKTSWDGAVVTTTTDILPAAKDKVATPAKLSWKFPKPFGLAGIAIDKFEYDKSGKFKFETSCDKALHTIKDLKVEVKSDLVNFGKATVGCSYTGLKDTLVSLEMVPAKVATSYTLELMRAFGPLNMGMKICAGKMPDIGCRYTSGPIFAAVVGNASLKSYAGHLFYKVSDNLKLAGTCAVKEGINDFGVGVEFQAAKDTKVKAKILKDQSILATVKYNLSKGFTFLCGIKYSSKGVGYGVQLSLE